MDVSGYRQKIAGSVRTKKYLLFLQKSRLVPESELRVLSKAAEHALPQHISIRLDDPNEGLKVLGVKNIEIVVLHHSLMGSSAELVGLAKRLKERKKVTIIFITNDEQGLIEAYRSDMALYEEMDDFVAAPVDPAELFRKLQKMGNVEARAAKRFSVDVLVKIRKVEDDTTVDVKLDDLSLVGCGMEVDSALGIQRGQQLQVQIPLQRFGIFHPQYADYLRLALRVRRVSIRGDNLGCSIEHLTSMQHDCLVNLLEQVSKRQRLAKMNPKERRGAQLNA